VCVCQLVANAVLFMCVNGVGVFHLWHTEHAHRKSSKKRENFSRNRATQAKQKRDQVRLYTLYFIQSAECVSPSAGGSERVHAALGFGKELKC